MFFAMAYAQEKQVPLMTPADAPPNGDAGELPHWDGKHHELWWGSQLVKRFRQPAGNQVTILAAFEEENWQHKMDDPLPGTDGIDPKERLHDAIKNLNRHQVAKLIRFHGDGSGQAITWEAVAPSFPSASPQLP